MKLSKLQQRKKQRNTDSYKNGLYLKKIKAVFVFIPEKSTTKLNEFGALISVGLTVHREIFDYTLDSIVAVPFCSNARHLQTTTLIE